MDIWVFKSKNCEAQGKGADADVLWLIVIGVQ